MSGVAGSGYFDEPSVWNLVRNPAADLGELHIEHACHRQHGHVEIGKEWPQRLLRPGSSVAKAGSQALRCVPRWMGACFAGDIDPAEQGSSEPVVEESVDAHLHDVIRHTIVGFATRRSLCTVGDAG